MEQTMTLEELEAQKESFQQKKEQTSIEKTLKRYETFKTLLKANVVLQPGCSKCESGYIKEKGKFPYVTKICECLSEVEFFKIVKEKLNNSNLQKETVLQYSLENYKEDTITIPLIYKLLTGEATKNWLYLYGSPGTGKTYTAILVLMLGALLERDILYVNVPNLMDNLRPSVEDKGKERMQRCIDADILVMDDIGQEKPSERVKERLYIIINERYMVKKITIFTSNVSLGELQNKLFHPAILSRMNHYCTPVIFGGIDKRQSE